MTLTDNTMATNIVKTIKSRCAGILELQGLGFIRADLMSDGNLIDTVPLYPKLYWQQIPFISANILRLDLVSENTEITVLLHGEITARTAEVIFTPIKNHDLDFHVNTFMRDDEQYLVLYTAGRIECKSALNRFKCAL